MQLILLIANGPAAGRKIVVRKGQVARVGRTEWADFPVREDSQMADVHFALESAAAGYLVRDLDSAQGTLLNGEAITAAAIHTGDEITAGSTTFTVRVDGESSAAPVESAQSTTTGAGTDDVDQPKRTAAEYCKTLPISDEARELLADDPSPAVFLETLVARQLYPDAVRFLAFLLPKPLAVGWGAGCVASVLAGAFSPAETAALEAAQAWAAEPSEEHRRAAEKAAAQSGTDTAPGWLALAAFWSGGSLAPVGLAEVPPEEKLTAQAITGALMMIAPHGAPLQATARYQSFLQQGKMLMADAVSG